jgi:hypothetical protein
MADYSKAWRGKTPRLPGPLALCREGVDGIAWYADAREQIARYSALQGVTVEYTAGVMAVTSPRLHVSRNVAATRRYVEGRSVEGLMRSVRAALAHFEDTGEIRGPKTGAFQRALLGDPAAVVVDVWMLRAFKQDERAKPAIYRRVTRGIRAVAAMAGVTPADCQAAIWTATRRRYGFKSNSPVVFDG